jgi:hypothetical protein
MRFRRFRIFAQNRRRRVNEFHSFLTKALMHIAGVAKSDAIIAVTRFEEAANGRKKGPRLFDCSASEGARADEGHLRATVKSCKTLGSLSNCPQDEVR